MPDTQNKDTSGHICKSITPLDTNCRRCVQIDERVRFGLRGEQNQVRR